MNATGDSDMQNHWIGVSSMQRKMLRRPLVKYDLIMAKSAGLAEAPSYKFRPITDISETDQAEVSAKVTMAVNETVANQLIDMPEGRRALMETVDMWHFLDPDKTPEFEPTEQEMAELAMMETQMQMLGNEANKKEEDDNASAETAA